MAPLGGRCGEDREEQEQAIFHVDSSNAADLLPDSLA